MRRLLPLLAVGALAVSAAACDLSPPAVTVGDLSVSRATLDSQLSAVAGSQAARCALSTLSEQNGSSVPAVTGTGDDTVTTAFAAYELTGLVRQTLEQRALAARGATVGPADLRAARQDYENELIAASSSQPACSLSGDALVTRLPASFLDEQARLLAYDEKVEQVLGHVDVSNAALRRSYAANPSQFTEQCVDLIVADDQAAAQTLHDQIAAGTSFATAAGSPGANTAEGPAGGQEPCVYLSTIESSLGPTIADVVAGLPVGQVAPPQSLSTTDPTTGQPTTIWLVLGVRQRQLQPFAAVEAGLRYELLQGHLSTLDTVLTRQAKATRIDLDPRYGQWSARAGVTPPTPPPAAFVLDPSAAGATSGGSATPAGG